MWDNQAVFVSRKPLSDKSTESGMFFSQDENGF
jgi:hypothetical protein